MNPNYLSQKLSEFFECLNIGRASTFPIFVFKPQTKAFQHAQPQMGNEIHIYFISKNLYSYHKDNHFFFLSTTSVLNAIFRAAFQSAFMPSNVPSALCFPFPFAHSGFLQIKVDWFMRCPFS